MNVSIAMKRDIGLTVLAGLCGTFGVAIAIGNAKEPVAGANKIAFPENFAKGMLEAAKPRPASWLSEVICRRLTLPNRGRYATSAIETIFHRSGQRCGAEDAARQGSGAHSRPESRGRPSK